ncbi:hypothetical protein TSOC_006118 [Tetrabaena socialis]|uniref:Uncharacterized protein n=1 Tax=Tetrabaena socialis TaxID=47790 RepID=A0A2J8A4I9_9CHLO|nr:hypothetical protein TSOC_006118 [Tetrabaena socialis]|eukprot:PNH07426.1 hypothetical protein TSOC_006118 [Tetrabaena socialis]
MGLLDRLSGRKAREEPQHAEPASASAPAEPMPSLPSTSPHADALRDVSPNSTLLGAAGLSAPQGRLYNPYEGLSAQVGPTKHMFHLPSGPEFVFEEEAAVRRRDWTQHLQFYCGGGYLGGGLVGVAGGLYKFAVTKPEVVTDTLKLKTNRLLNTTGGCDLSPKCGRRGPSQRHPLNLRDRLEGHERVDGLEAALTQTKEERDALQTALAREKARSAAIVDALRTEAETRHAVAAAKLAEQAEMLSEHQQQLGQVQQQQSELEIEVAKLKAERKAREAAHAEQLAALEAQLAEARAEAEEEQARLEEEARRASSHHALALLLDRPLPP